MSKEPTRIQLTDNLSKWVLKLLDCAETERLASTSTHNILIWNDIMGVLNKIIRNQSYNTTHDRLKLNSYRKLYLSNDYYDSYGRTKSIYLSEVNVVYSMELVVGFITYLDRWFVDYTDCNHLCGGYNNFK